VLYEYPFIPKRFTLSDNEVMSYVDEGKGETLFMLHGNPTWSYFYRNAISELSKKYRVIAVDHIGCGLSTKPQDYEYTLNKHINNFSELATHLNLTSYSLILHDWGGAIGMGHAVNNVEKIRKIVLMNTASFTSINIPPRIAFLKIPIWRDLLIRRLNLFALPAAFMAPAKLLKNEVRQGFLFPYNSYKNRIAVTNFVKDIPLTKCHRSYETLHTIEKKLTNIKSPIFLMWGMKDFCFTPYFLKRYQEFFPNAKTLELPKASHYLLEDAKIEAINAIGVFLEESNSKHCQ